MKSRQDYDRGYRDRPFELRLPGDAIKDHVIARRARQAMHDRPGKLLDVGCGIGHTTLLLSHRLHNCNVTAIDFSQEALRTALLRVPTAFFIQADARRLPFHSNYFSVVVAKDIAEHLPEDQELFAELHRVSSTGASILLYLPSTLDGMNFSVESMLKRLTGYTIDQAVGHVRRYARNKIMLKLEEQGFEIEDCFYFPHITMSLLAVLFVWAYYKFFAVGSLEFTPHTSYLPRAFIYLLIGIFRVAEIIGWIEYALLKKLPGAGLFVFARKNV